MDFRLISIDLVVEVPGESALHIALTNNYSQPVPRRNFNITVSLSLVQIIALVRIFRLIDKLISMKTT